MDIEAIWFYNQDAQWKKILPELISIAKKAGIRLGCPDFVNSGWGDVQTTNTCCGVNVSNPTTFNTHFWKQDIQKANKKGYLVTNKELLELTWDGIGDYQKGKEIISAEESKDFYTLNDIVN